MVLLIIVHNEDKISILYWVTLGNYNYSLYHAKTILYFFSLNSGLSAQPTETPDLPTNALVIIVLGILLFVAGIVIFGLVGTTIIVHKR